PCLWAYACGPMPVGLCLWAYACGPMPVGLCLWAYASVIQHVGKMASHRVAYPESWNFGWYDARQPGPGCPPGWMDDPGWTHADLYQAAALQEGLRPPLRRR